MYKSIALMAVLATGAAFTVQKPVLAMEHGQKMSQNDMAREPASGVTRGRGVINAVNIPAGSINITHEPIPALSWPTMTMDLPVTDQVDLSGVNAGDSVTCGNVDGNVHAGDSVECRDVEGGVTAGDGVRCGNIRGRVVAGDSVTCTGLAPDKD